jgi:hypothetical protein
MYIIIIILSIIINDLVLGVFFKKKYRPEFPIISYERLEKFTSWDNHLGWCNQANIKKRDSRDTRYLIDNKNSVFFTTDNFGGRISYSPSNGKPFKVSTFGDSFCMGREVEDNQTYQYILGKLLNIKVSNYGVGNYGLDQAILRLERDFDKDPSNMVILGVTSGTVARMVSVYRHYLEHGNVLAIKPRFEIDLKTQELMTIDYPFKDKYQLLEYYHYKNFFRKHDEHYKSFKRNHPPFFSFYLFKKIFEKFQKNSFKFNQKKMKVNGQLMLWFRKTELLDATLKRYYSFSRNKSFDPILLIHHDRQFLELLENKLEDWKKLLISLEKNTKVTIIDSYDFLKDYDFNKLYVRKDGTGHHSPYANQIIAEQLALRIKDIYKQMVKG